jgi:hypothetical protein
MLDLQAIDLATNKENIPLVPNPQNKRSAPQLNRMFQKPKEVCE